jgi:hypothetical protein
MNAGPSTAVYLHAMTYRVPGERDEPIDAEAAAVAELGRRARILRQGIHLPVLLVGIAVGVVAYFAVREALLASLGAHIPWLTGALTVGPLFAYAFRIAPRIADAIAARLLPKWRAELARRYDLDEAVLAETTQFL